MDRNFRTLLRDPVTGAHPSYLRLITVWFLLIFATMGSWEIGGLLPVAVKHAEAAVIVIAFLKVLLVMREFMDIRAAGWILQAAALSWATLVCLALVLCVLI